MQDKTVIITGGSRGMGQRLALRLGAEKANVVVNYRRDDEAAKDTVARDRGARRHRPRGPGRHRRDRVGRVAGRPVGRAVRRPRRGRGERRGQRLQAAVADPRAPHREDDGPHGPGLPRPGPRSPRRTCRRRPRHGGVGMGQLPRPARARSARRGQGGDGDDREVPRDRAGQGKHHRRSGVCPGPIDTDSFRYYAGDAWEDYAKHWLAQTPSGAYPTPDEVADVMAYLCSPAARRSTARRSWSTAGCRSRPCRSASGRTERGEPPRRSPRPSSSSCARSSGRPAARDRGGGGRRRAQLTIGELAEASNRLANAFIGLGPAARRPGRLRRPEPPRVRRPGVRAAQGGPGQGPAQPPLRPAGAAALHRARRRAAGRGRHGLRGGPRRGVRRRRTAARCHRRAGRVDVLRRAGRRAARRRRVQCRSGPTTSTTSGSARARPESPRASRSPIAGRARRSSATPG